MNSSLVLFPQYLPSGSRDNKTAIELFLVGLRVWDVGLRRRMYDKRSNPGRGYSV
jgi:hypothetical protein